MRCQIKCSLCLLSKLCLTISLLNACAPTQPELNRHPPDYGFPEQLDMRLQPAPQAGTQGAGIPDGSDGLWPDIRGYWRIDHRTTLRSELPVLLEEVETTIDTVLIAQVGQEEGDLWIHYQVCDVRMENTPGYNHTLLPDAFLEALPYRARPAQLRSIEDGWQLIVPRQYELRGLSMEKPELDPFPVDESDLRIFDQDRDGSPGLTARLVGFPEGEVNLIQRSWDEWVGTLNLDEADRQIIEITGEIRWGDEQTIIRATNEVLLVEVSRWIPNDPMLHRFEMRRANQLVCPPRREAPQPDI